MSRVQRTVRPTQQQQLPRMSCRVVQQPVEYHEELLPHVYVARKGRPPRPGDKTEVQPGPEQTLAGRAAQDQHLLPLHVLRAPQVRRVH